jgi:hypothetical protein
MNNLTDPLRPSGASGNRQDEARSGVVYNLQAGTVQSLTRSVSVKELSLKLSRRAALWSWAN